MALESLRNLWTGGEKVQQAKTTIDELGHRSSLNNRQRRRLKSAQSEITRWNFIRRGTAVVGVALGAAVTGGAILRPWEDDDPSESSVNFLPTPDKPVYSSIEPGLSGEFTQERAQNLARNCAKDLAKFVGVEIDAEKVASAVRLVETKDKFAELWVQSTPGYDPFEPEEMKSTFGVTIEREGLEDGVILLNKEYFVQSIGALAGDKDYDLHFYELFESIVQHEIVHFIAKKYVSPILHQVVTNEVFGEEDVAPRFVKGAFLEGVRDGVYLSAYEDLEEAETYFISDILMADKKREGGMTISVPEAIVPRLLLLRKLMAKIEPDQIKAAKLLQRLRMQEGGREAFCQRIAVANKDKNIQSGKELLYGMTVLRAVDDADTNRFNLLVNR